jgi:hypothetical protein
MIIKKKRHDIRLLPMKLCNIAVEMLAYYQGHFLLLLIQIFTFYIKFLIHKNIMSFFFNYHSYACLVHSTFIAYHGENKNKNATNRRIQFVVVITSRRINALTILIQSNLYYAVTFGTR